MDVLFLMRFFRLYPGLNLSFEHNSVRKNLFLSACFCWDSRLSLREMHQKHKFVGTLGYGNSYLELLFRHFKKFRLHAILHDAAEAVRAHSGKSPGYCYMIGRGPSSCLLGHLTGLLFCLYVQNHSALHFQFCWFLKQYVLPCTRYRAKWEKHNWRTATLYWWFCTRIFILSTKVFLT